MAGISKKSQEILDYRVANKHLPMEAVAQKFGVKRQWVYILCKKHGVQSAYEP
jgi:predicted DNA-binding transcriptional regulator AlpA